MKRRKTVRKTLTLGLTTVFLTLGSLQLVFANNESANYVQRDDHIGRVTGVRRVSDNHFEIQYSSEHKGRLIFYNNHVVRYHVVGINDQFKETPTPSSADRPAEIVSKPLSSYATIQASVSENNDVFVLESDKVQVKFNKANGLFSIFDKEENKTIVSEVEPLSFKDGATTQNLNTTNESQYYGGGTQNGRFAHKGNSINIVNENNWVDGGVASPNPFYWTTQGYGVLRHTFKPGRYDFEENDANRVTTTHQDNHFDAFYFVNKQPVNILKDYYELTGSPVVLPRFALYEGHLNAYNRDTWVEVPQGTPGAVYFEEKGKWYAEYQPNQLGDRQGFKETLNGSPQDENYPFTARAVVDRYERNDMPLGWILVNDGYGAGYGQADSLAGNIQNLREFSQYALNKGVYTGLWTQSDLHPNPNLAPLLQRDLPSEVEDGLVRVLKTDVAWVGPGYSFGLNGIADAASILSSRGNNTRPFIITLDGWGGTQRYGAIWTGDQTGGEWEYIRFHIPTYIGTGLSGNPNISSDMDGIFGGGNNVINTRDFQWKTFTPLQLNMDGWGRNPKTPFAFDKKTSDINRMYLKLKSQLIPYSYSIGHQAANDKPMIRAMFLDFPNEAIHYTKAVQYQFMYGDSMLIAPVYENVNADAQGNDVRNGIYLPKNEEWIDYFTGKIYEGGQMLNNVDAPIWKLPIFVKKGAIIPVTKPHNNVSEYDETFRSVEFYPGKATSFELVEDDGITQEYLQNKTAKTTITSVVDENNKATLTINATNNNYNSFVKEKQTQFNVNVSTEPTATRLFVNDVETPLRKVNTLAEFEAGENVYFYDEAPNLNTSSKDETFKNEAIIKNPVVRVKTSRLDVTQNSFKLELDNYQLNEKAQNIPTQEAGTAPEVSVSATSPTSITLGLSSQENNVVGYEIEADGIIYRGINGDTFTHDNLAFQSTHRYKVRAITDTHYTPWSDVVEATTDANPLEHAIDGITVQSNRNAQGGTPHEHLVDKNLSSMYHSNWSETSVPESLVFDLQKAYELDKLEYVPRNDGGTNGIITAASFEASLDGKNWKPLNIDVNWAANATRKEQVFPSNTKARYIRMNVTSTAPNSKFVSGQELLIFKKPTHKGNVVGDITGDGHIDSNDVTSFTNYAGLRRGIDRDFEGYVEVADLNMNDVIDAYDTYYTTKQIGEGNDKTPLPASGELQWNVSKKDVTAGEEIDVTLKANNLRDVEAINANFPIDSSKFEVVSSVSVNNTLNTMNNFSTIRTHGDGSKEAFVILSNNKTAPAINGDHTVATFRLRALADATIELPTTNNFVVGSDLNVVDANTETHYVEPSRITVSGNDDVYQPGYGLANLNDNNLDTMAELKWDWEPNYINGQLPESVTLPQDITFTFDKTNPTYLEGVQIFKRTPGNGTVTKYKVSVYRGDEKVYESSETDIPFEKAVETHQLDKAYYADKVVLTILEAKTSPTTVNNKMMTLKDVRFIENPTARQDKVIDGSYLNVKADESVFQDGYGPEKLIDGDLTTLAELKWDWEPNHVNGRLPETITLPQSFELTRKDNQLMHLNGVDIFKRTPGNGTVTKYKVEAFRDGKRIYHSDEMLVPFEDAVINHNFNNKVITADKVVVTVLEARTSATNINNQMMTLKEIQLREISNELLTPEELQTNSSAHGDGTQSTLPSLLIEEETLSFETVYENDATLEKGQQRIKVEGKAGSITRYIEVTTDSDGVIVRRVVEEKRVDPTTQIISVGTKETVVDKEKLQSKVDELNNIDEKLYTKESYERLLVQLNSAKAVLENASSTQENIDEALQNLVAALNSLTKIEPKNEEKPSNDIRKDDLSSNEDAKPNENIKPSNTLKENEPKKLDKTSKKDVDTSDQTSGIVGLVVAGLGLVVLRKHKKNK